MIVVSNTSPLCYLVLIGCADVLPKLYGEVLTTHTVLIELRHPDAPDLVRRWAATPPDWLRVHPDPHEPDQSLTSLHAGERTAVLLAEASTGWRNRDVAVTDLAHRPVRGHRVATGYPPGQHLDEGAARGRLGHGEGGNRRRSRGEPEAGAPASEVLERGAEGAAGELKSGRMIQSGSES